jgi:hypothetical protein
MTPRENMRIAIASVICLVLQNAVDRMDPWIGVVTSSPLRRVSKLRAPISACRQTRQ